MISKMKYNLPEHIMSRVNMCNERKGVQTRKQRNKENKEINSFQIIFSNYHNEGNANRLTTNIIKANYGPSKCLEVEMRIYIYP